METANFFLITFIGKKKLDTGNVNLDQLFKFKVYKPFRT